MKKVYIIGAMAAMFTACKPSVNVTTPATSGNANFTNYLAVGCSYTAGYADKSLTVSGQLNSYPQRLFEQFHTIADGQGAVDPFILPLLPSDNGYPEAKLIMGTVTHCDGRISLSPIANPMPLDTNGSWRFKSMINNDQINNIGVPKLRVADMTVQGYAAANVYAKRFFYDAAKTPLAELQSRVRNVHPTFYTVWMGVTDVLGFATSGGSGDGTGDAVPVALNIYDSKDITPTKVFEDLYDSIVTAVSSEGALGALIGLPDITKLPYFTTVPANGLYLSRQGQVDTLRMIYTDVREKTFDLGSNYYIIRDHNNNIRQAVPGELILLNIPQDSITCAGWGSYKPIPREYVLTTDELQHIRAAVDRFNFVINKHAQDRNVPFVDMKSFFVSLESGIHYNGIDYNTEFVSGGAFSLDAIHLNPRGNALLANHILQTVNTFYKATIPLTDVNKYPGVKFP